MALPDEPRARALERLDPSTLVMLEKARPLDWIDGRVHLDIGDRYYEAVGPEGFERYCRELVVEMSRWSLFLPILAGRLRRPAALLKALPLAFQTLFRNAGRIEVSGRPARVIVRHRDPPPAMIQAISWVDGFAGTLLGMLDLSQTEGIVSGAAQGSDFRFEVRW